MKRRNVDLTKSRRPVKKIKLYDGFYTGLLVYLKLLLLWTSVMGGDFLLEFRLEYLYPVYLLVHNSYEAYKFQGVAFTVLLICIVISVDVICLGVIPSPWLYILASLAVWAQVGWSLTPLGPFLLLPTLLYIDGRSLRPLPTQPLCPLAAHCLGLPLVTTCFTLKSFITHKLRQRTRDEVSRQNDVLYNLLWEALPVGAEPTENGQAVKEKVLAEKVQVQAHAQLVVQAPAQSFLPARRKSMELVEDGGRQQGSAQGAVQTQQVTPNPCACTLRSRVKKEECCYKLETEVKRLRSELHSSRSSDAELRHTINQTQASEKALRTEVALLQGEHESLQLKYSSLFAKGQEERREYERRLGEERRLKEREVMKQKKASLDCPGDCKRKLLQLERERDTLRTSTKQYEDKLQRTERELQNVKSTLMLEQRNKELPGETTKLLNLLTNIQDQNKHLEQSLTAETRLKLDLFSALGEARRQLGLRESMLKQREEELEECRSQLVELLAVGDLNRIWNGGGVTGKGQGGQQQQGGAGQQQFQ